MTEKHAENLYGAAPEGDEDPHASQAVPDPGESPSYSGPFYIYSRAELEAMDPPLTAGDLNSSHIGHRMRITTPVGGGRSSTIEGLLYGVEHGVNLISEKAVCEVESFTLGQRWVSVRMMVNMGARISPEATVELLD